MCIRDREGESPLLQGQTTMLGMTVRELKPAEARRLGIREAVSYTHLRAHETVLDLVCRLLLEKKTGAQGWIWTTWETHPIQATSLDDRTS